MLETEKPIIAQINGPAAGLGLVLALFCDCTIASEDAKLGDPHVSLGLVAGDGGAAILPLLVGPHVAKELLLTSRYLSGRQAADLGMINRAVPAEQLAAEVRELAAEIAAQPAYAARATKAVVNRYLRSAVHEALELSLAYEEVSRGLPAYPEAVARWREARGGNG
jgi:enoyl-CoA hydratase/carnithine racemase